VARDDLAGGEASRRLGDRPLRDNLKGPPWVAGLEGTQTRGWWPSRRCRRRCGHGDVGAAAVLGRWCGCPFPVRRCVNARARACAGVRARRVNGTARLGVGRKRGRRGGNRGGARAGAMGGGGQGDRGRHKRACEEAAAGGKACTRQPRGRRSLPYDRVCEASDHGEAVAARSTEARRRGPAQKKGPKVQPRLPCWRARVLGCTLARERRARVDARVNVNAPARGLERGLHGVAHDGEKD
jgi:hypothetical protein